MPQNPKPTAYQKLAAQLQLLRSRGASRERIQQEIDHFKTAMDAKSKAERALTGAEKVAGFASKMGSGATFGLLDEAVGVFDEDAKNEQRFLQKQFSEEQPAVAFGAEVLGSLAMPGSVLKAAPRTAKILPRVTREAGRMLPKVSLGKAGTVLAEGAIQGGLAGFGNAEGDVGDRLGETATGAVMGSVAAGALGGAAKMAGKTVGNALDRVGVRTPRQARTMEQIADGLGDTDIAAGRARLAELQARRLGGETMVADVLPQGEGALRQAATSNRTVRSTVDTELRERSNRLANAADDRFSEYTESPRVSGDKARAERLKKAQDEAGPLYEQSRAEAAAYDPAVSEPDFVMPEVLKRPRIQAAVRRVIADDPERFAGNVFADPKLSHDVLDQAYKDMGEDIRYLTSKVRAKTATAAERRSVKRMIRDRDKLKAAISVRSPTYPKALDKYAGEIAHRDAYDLGSQRAPADMIPEQMAALEPATVPDFKQAKAEALRGRVPNQDIGEFARFSDVLKPIGTREAAETFKATWGEKAYREYVADLLEMAKLQRMRGGVGESTTVDKLMEQAQGDPEAIASFLRNALTGDVGGALRSAAAGSSKVTQVLDRLRRSETGRQRAEFLTQRGDDKVKAALDYIEKLRAEGKLPRPRNWKRPNVTAATARIAGSAAGQP